MAQSSKQKHVSLKQKKIGTEHNYIILSIVVVELYECNKSPPEWIANYFKLQNMKYIIQFGSRPRHCYSNYLNNFFIMVSTG